MNGHAVQTFALLDCASEVSLVENNLAIDLGLKGKKKTLKMKTLNSETVHDSRVVSFTVKGINDSDSEKIHIHNAWTVSAGTFGGVSQTVQADMKHIEDLNIESVVPGQVQILIGISTPEAHLQEDIRRGSKEQPIAVRTPLGWSLIGGKFMIKSKQRSTSPSCVMISLAGKWNNSGRQNPWGLFTLTRHLFQ